MPEYVIERTSGTGRPQWFSGSWDHGMPLWAQNSDEAEQFLTWTKAELTLETLRRVASTADRLWIVEIIS
jgi:hypothetical protein